MAHIDDSILKGMTDDQRLRLWVLVNYPFEVAQRVYDFIMAGAAKFPIVNDIAQLKSIAPQQRGVLKRAGIMSLANLSQRTRKSVSNLRYIGPKTIETLDHILRVANLKWYDE